MNKKIKGVRRALISRKYNKIIDKFSNISEYNVLSMPAFKVIVDEKIRNDNIGGLIIGDINDLFAVNKARGKETVNFMIKSFFYQIKGTIEINGFKDYKIAKMGDEIYIYIADINEEKLQKISQQIDKISVNELTISSGYSINLSNGLIPALEEADEKMHINKTKFKNQRLKRIFGDEYKEIINNVLESYLNKLRINLDKLNNTDIKNLNNTFQKAICEFSSDSNGIIDEDKIDKSDDSFNSLKRKYYKEAIALYGQEDYELIHKHILYNMLLNCNIEDVTPADVFRKLKYKQVFKNLKKDKMENHFSLIGFKLSGLKPINDICGHEEGNKAICEALEHFKSTMNSKKIKFYSDIVTKSNGDSYIITQELTAEDCENINSLLNSYDNPDSPYNFSILSSNIKGDKNFLTNKNFMQYIDSLILVMEKDLENETFKKKIKSVPEIKNAIKGIYNQILNFEDMGILFPEGIKNKGVVLNLIQEEFQKYIKTLNNNMNKANLSSSKIILDENKTTQIEEAKSLEPEI